MVSSALIEAAVEGAKAWDFGRAGAAQSAAAAPYLGPDTVHRGGLAGAGHAPAQLNMAAKVGKIWKNNSVFTAINWIRRNFPDARVAVQSIGTEENDLSHPMALLLARPNPRYSYSTLSAGMVFSYVADGNAYALKVRNGWGEPVELWWRPHWMLRPVRESGSREFIDYYLYRPDNWTAPQRIDPKDVVHLRNGIDPEDETRGLSDLKHLLLSVYTEQEVNRFMAAMLGKLGLVGAVIKHKPPMINEVEGKRGHLKAGQADEIKQKFEQNFTGENVGSAMVLDGDFDVDFPSVAVDASFLEKAKDISQADIAAAIGLPPVVLGWHVGLKTATAKASHEDARKQAYRECLMPMQRSMAEDYDIQLLPDFADNRRFRTVFDYRYVATLAEDENAKAKRWTDVFKGGVAMRSEARKALGMKAQPADDVYHPGTGGADAAADDQQDPKKGKPRPGTRPGAQEEGDDDE